MMFIMKAVIVNKYIVADPKICHGKLTFKDTRIMVWQVLEMLASGENQKEIIKAFPSLTREHIKSALEYASSITRQNYAIINTQTQVSP